MTEEMTFLMSWSLKIDYPLSESFKLSAFGGLRKTILPMD